MMQDCFDQLHEYDHRTLFENTDYPWIALDRLQNYIEQWFQQDRENEPGEYQYMLRGVTFHKIIDPQGNVKQKMIVIQYPLQVKQPVFLEPWRIFIGQGTLLESGVIIKSPAIIGDHCEIRHTAYLRGNVILGNGCVAGHATEIKNSIFMNKAAAGHFAYVGDSILGDDVNLGAGTKLANLEFRTRKEKKSRNYRSIIIKCPEQKIETGRKKLGAVLGDCVETGCNCVLAPGVVLGKDSWVLPNVFVKKKVYAPRSRLR
jgi:NDP-sugar pyrophosphorylase family protein